MRYFFDSSALVKRYRNEPGSEVVKDIFLELPSPIIVISSLSLCEVASALNKAKNRGEIKAQELLIATTEFYSDCVEQKIGVIDVNRGHLLCANDLILDHNLTSLDAIFLALFTL